MPKPPPGPQMWDARYGAADFAYGTAPNDFIAAQAGALPAGGPVLCLAAGEGRNAVFLAERGHAITGMDLSAVGLEKAQRLAAERGVAITTAVANLAEYDLGHGQWAGIVSVFCHLPSPLRADVHRRVVEALAPGGVFLLEAYSPAQLKHGTGGPPMLPMLYPLEAVQAELAGLEWVLAREVEREVHEGEHHKGLSAVIQLVGRKPG